MLVSYTSLFGIKEQVIFHPIPKKLIPENEDKSNGKITNDIRLGVHIKEIIEEDHFICFYDNQHNYFGELNYSIYIDQNGYKFCYLENIKVNSHQKRMKIGTRIYDHFYTKMRHQGCAYFLGVLSSHDNIEARSFFTKRKCYVDENSDYIYRRLCKHPPQSPVWVK